MVLKVEAKAKAGGCISRFLICGWHSYWLLALKSTPSKTLLATLIVHISCFDSVELVPIFLLIQSQTDS